MASGSSPIMDATGESTLSSNRPIVEVDGVIATPIGERTVQPLSTQSKCAMTALVIGALAAAAIVGLGAASMCGPIGSPGFYGSIVGGGIVFIFCAIALNKLALGNCKAEQREATSSTESRDATAVASGGNPGEPMFPYSPIGQAAIDFARQKLRENPVEATEYANCLGVKLHQPVNLEIALLSTLRDTYIDAFEQAVKNHPDPWSQQEVIEAADNLIKISYAISCLTLDDLPEFTRVLEEKTRSFLRRGEQRTYAQALTRRDSYQYLAYFYCTTAYHTIRGGATWQRLPIAREGLLCPDVIPQEHADSFYAEGTFQSLWRELYNDYCNRIRLYVTDEALERAANGSLRYFRWTINDEGPNTFRHTPDTLP